MTTKIRAAETADIGFLVDSWHRCWAGLRKPEERKYVTKDLLLPIIAYLFKQGKSLVAVDDKGKIVGWICGSPEKKRLFFCYVILAERSKGLMLAMVLKLFGTTTGIEACCDGTKNVMRSLCVQYEWTWCPTLPWILYVEGMKNAGKCSNEVYQTRPNPHQSRQIPA